MSNGSVPKRRRRLGCFTTLFLIAAVIILAGVGVWKFVINKGPGPEARRLMNGPVDVVSSKAVADVFRANGVNGVSVQVVPLPGVNQGTVAFVTLDPSLGFKPASGSTAKRNQALSIIKGIVAANNHSRINLQRVGVSYQEGGQAVLAVTAPMSALNSAAAGQVTDKQFMASVHAKVYPGGARAVADKFGITITDIKITR